MDKHNQERIVAAAIFYGATISLPPPARHHTILHSMELVMLFGVFVQPEQQGFLTNTGRFVNRVEGFYIAHKAEQMIAHTSSSKEPVLYSEDLW